MTNEQLYSELEQQAKSIEDARLQLEKQIAALTNELKGLELQSKAFRVAMETLAPGCCFPAREEPVEDEYRPQVRPGYPNADRKKSRYANYEQ